MSKLILKKDGKCQLCNQNADRLFHIDDEEIKIKRCGNCMASILVADKWNLTKPPYVSMIKESNSYCSCGNKFQSDREQELKICRECR